jgi:nucleoside-diphosphate kinase
MERTLIILKPDAVQRGLIGQIITRFENKGIQVVGAKFMKIPASLAEQHYAPHKGKPFYEGLVKFMTSSPVLVLALQGKDVIAISRKMMGATFGSKAEPGTIRGDFGVSNSFNLIHGSDSPESAQKELALWFRTDELVEWTPAALGWVYDLSKGTPE